MSGAEEARETIAHIAATLRAFVRAGGALEATLLLDQGPSAPLLAVACPVDGPVLLGEGEKVVQLDADRLAAATLVLPDVRAAQPFDVDTVRAQIAAPLGEVERCAGAVRALVETFPGRSVLSVAFATSDPEAPLQIVARGGDPLVLGLGEEQFVMPAGWPS